MICERAKKIDIRHYKDGTYPIVTMANGYVSPVVSTPSHFGGERHWFLCPRCERRCAVLYPLICRICAEDRYRSELMSQQDRLIKKARRVRERLGEGRTPNLGGSFASKPKGMHWATYHRLVDEGRRLEWEIATLAAARFGLRPEEVF